jgi:hypothetical protein
MQSCVIAQKQICKKDLKLTGFNLANRKALLLQGFS